MKRKRKSHCKDDSGKSRRIKGNSNEPNAGVAVSHPVLQSYYPKLKTLRQYLLSKLPESSRKVRRLLQKDRKDGRKHQAEIESKCEELLDSIIVGHSDNVTEVQRQNLIKDLEQFSQTIASTSESVGTQNRVSISEVIDFTIWHLFNKTFAHQQHPPHILCYGMNRALPTWQQYATPGARSSLPGLVVSTYNRHVETMKGPAWASIMNNLGKHGDLIMIDLVLNCGVFVPIAGGVSNYYQLSGVAISELNHIPNVVEGARGKLNLGREFQKVELQQSREVLRKAAAIRFVRSRMLYARASLNAKGGVAFGLRHIHVFNRYADASNMQHTVHIMKYIFPRQFKLHNVFTSKTDPKETAQPYKDYTLREYEISRLDMSYTIRQSDNDHEKHATKAVPKRLRGKTTALISKLQKLHNACAYTELLNYYCPCPQTSKSTLSQRSSSRIRSSNAANRKMQEQLHFTELATPATQVSAFCRATISRVFPNELFGEGEEGLKTKGVIMRNVDLFTRARRFESLTLDLVLEGIKIENLAWLRPPNLKAGQKMSLSDFEKRKEIMSELVYYIFDSFVVPLIRTNFHVTESNSHRNRLFFFRHDVWKDLTEPALSSLKMAMFEEIPNDTAQKTLATRSLGYSQLRLLPKDKGMRPISNLRRRGMVMRNGKKVFSKSVNAVLAPAFQVLNCEKTMKPFNLGASIFSVPGIYDKIKLFKARLCQNGPSTQQLYFAKVDVKSCFDSIPQERLLDLIEELVAADLYHINRHTEVKAAGHFDTRAVTESRKSTKSFHSKASRESESDNFAELIQLTSKSSTSRTVFIDHVAQQRVKKKQFFELLDDHIRQNIVRIGKKFYRQKHGIAQGSVVSSLLCNFFYADFEKSVLHFLNNDDCVLLRLIDDFLLITTDQAAARRFVTVMHGGNMDYCISVAAEKSLVNFDMRLGPLTIPRCPTQRGFPYCGMLLDCRTLDISKDAASGRLSDALTVEYARSPGQTFRRKILSGLKIQMQAMLLDTAHNSHATVLTNLHRSLSETASRCLQYLRCLALVKIRRPDSRALIQTIEATAAVTFAMMRSKRRHHPRYVCAIGRGTVRWLTLVAFSQAFAAKQARWSETITWLDRETATWPREIRQHGHLRMLLGRVVGSER